MDRSKAFKRNGDPGFGRFFEAESKVQGRGTGDFAVAGQKEYLCAY